MFPQHFSENLTPNKKFTHFILKHFYRILCVDGNPAPSKQIPGKIPRKTINKLKAKDQNNRTSPLAKDKSGDNNKLEHADGIEINKFAKKSPLRITCLLLEGTSEFYYFYSTNIIFTIQS